jgi:hypothetical protein
MSDEQLIRALALILAELHIQNEQADPCNYTLTRLAESFEDYISEGEFFPPGKYEERDENGEKTINEGAPLLEVLLRLKYKAK